MQGPQETQGQSLGREDPLEEEMATLSSILAWEIPWTEEPAGLQSMGSQRVRHNWKIEHTRTYTNAKSQREEIKGIYTWTVEVKLS